MLIHSAAASAGLIKVTCSHCGEVQAKARNKSGRYVCRKCHHAFGKGVTLNTNSARKKR